MPAHPHAQLVAHLEPTHYPLARPSLSRPSTCTLAAGQHVRPPTSETVVVVPPTSTMSSCSGGHGGDDASGGAPVGGPDLRPAVCAYSTATHSGGGSSSQP